MPEPLPLSQRASMLRLQKPNLYVRFSAGRRDLGDPECRVCGADIHERDGDWFDGHGRSEDISPHRHNHEPAVAMGPTFGPLEYLDVTYQTVRYESEVLAAFDTSREDWILSDLAGPHAGEAYSDITIWTEHVPGERVRGT